jgi:Flp pilus assembly protein CpaB
MSIQSFTGRLTSSRRGAVLLGIVAAALAALLLGAYIWSYRDSVNASSTPTQVLVAKRLIAQGTPGSVIATKQLYEISAATGDAVKEGAISDPGLLNGTIAAVDIFPGQQLTSADFAAGAATGGASDLKGAQRAVTIPTEGALGLQALQPGTRVDIYQQLSGPTGVLVKLFRANILVLGTEDTDVILQVPSLDVSDTLYAAQHTQLMFVQRPTSGAFPTRPTVATKASMLQYTDTHR